MKQIEQNEQHLRKEGNQYARRYSLLCDRAMQEVIDLVQNFDAIYDWENAPRKYGCLPETLLLRNIDAKLRHLYEMERDESKYFTNETTVAYAVKWVSDYIGDVIDIEALLKGELFK